MSRRILITSDIHLTARPQDEYRWDIFRWLQVRAANHDATEIAILGDLTDQKDCHPSALVNRIFDEVSALSTVAPVTILKGNHDYGADDQTPFFRFLDALPGVSYVSEPQVDDDGVTWLPHTRRWRSAWASLWDHFKVAPVIFAHQTFEGATASNGFAMEGISPGTFSTKKCKGKVISGDIHVPQRLGNIYYCGSPHPVAFGDSFEPRALLWSDGKLTTIRRTTIKKAVVRIKEPEALRQHELSEGDMVKIIVTLPREDFPLWDRVKQATLDEAAALELTVCGLELRELKADQPATQKVRVRGVRGRELRAAPPTLLEQYGKARKVPEPYIDAGKKLL